MDLYQQLIEGLTSVIGIKDRQPSRLFGLAMGFSAAAYFLTFISMAICLTQFKSIKSKLWIIRVIDKLHYKLFRDHAGQKYVMHELTVLLLTTAITLLGIYNRYSKVVLTLSMLFMSDLYQYTLYIVVEEPIIESNRYIKSMSNIRYFISLTIEVIHQLTISNWGFRDLSQIYLVGWLTNLIQSYNTDYQLYEYGISIAELFVAYVIYQVIKQFLIFSLWIGVKLNKRVVIQIPGVLISSIAIVVIFFTVITKIIYLGDKWDLGEYITSPGYPLHDSLDSNQYNDQILKPINQPFIMYSKDQLQQYFKLKDTDLDKLQSYDNNILTKDLSNWAKNGNNVQSLWHLDSHLRFSTQNSWDDNKWIWSFNQKYLNTKGLLSLSGNLFSMIRRKGMAIPVLLDLKNKYFVSCQLATCGSMSAQPMLKDDEDISTDFVQKDRSIQEFYQSPETDFSQVANPLNDKSYIVYDNYKVQSSDDWLYELFRRPSFIQYIYRRMASKDDDAQLVGRIGYRRPLILAMTLQPVIDIESIKCYGNKIKFNFEDSQTSQVPLNFGYHITTSPHVQYGEQNDESSWEMFKTSNVVGYAERKDVKQYLTQQWQNNFQNKDINSCYWLSQPFGVGHTYTIMVYPQIIEGEDNNKSNDNYPKIALNVQPISTAITTNGLLDDFFINEDSIIIPHSKAFRVEMVQDPIHPQTKNFNQTMKSLYQVEDHLYHTNQDTDYAQQQNLLNYDDLMLLQVPAFITCIFVIWYQAFYTNYNLIIKNQTNKQEFLDQSFENIN